MVTIEGRKLGGEKKTQNINISTDTLSSLKGKEIKRETQDNIDKFKGDITYKQLSRLNINQRLYFVTKNKVKPSEIVKGKKIIFDFHGNMKLYRRVSAGFIIPDNVIQIEAGGKIWTRDKHNKEFFYNSKNKKISISRLLIGSLDSQKKGVYSEITVISLKQTNKSKEKEEIQKIKETPKQTLIKKGVKSKVENLLLNNLSYISDIKDPNSLKIGNYINFNFPNKELYLKTSAGKIISNNINFLKTLDGQIWKRENGKGEFFNKNGKRLTIGDSKYTRGYSRLQVVGKSEIFSNIKNYNELKKSPINYRLQNISDFVGDSSNLEEGNNIKIDFSKGIGLGRASLGEVMPIEIRSIKDSNNKIYTRLDNTEFGEFLDKNMNRLRIDHGNIITIFKSKKIEEVEFNINNHKKRINSLEYKKELYTKIDILSKKYFMPKKYILALLKGENQNYDYLLKVKGKDSTAFGLLQMINSTWNDYGKGLDRKSISGQLNAGFNYLNHIKKLVTKKNNREGLNMTVDELWLEVITLYHTGPYILSVSNKKSIARNLKGNPGIITIIKDLYNLDSVTAKNVTPKMYLAGAKKYYSSKLV